MFATVSADGHEWWLDEPPTPRTEAGDPAQVRRLLAGIPHGTFVMTSAHDGARGGVLVRWVQAAAVSPLDCRLVFSLDLEADCGFCVGRVVSAAVAGAA